MKDCKRKAAHLPETPGVYLMKDHRKKVIYIGKAKNLKRRVSSYFVHNKNHSEKVKQLVQTICDFDYQLVATEFDALLLECQLIHQYRPFYNQQMNHYEEYGYFQLLDTAPYLNVLTAWSDHGLIVGPFYKKSKMQEVKQIINSVYRLTGPLKFAEGIVYPYTTENDRAPEFQARLLEIKATLLGRSEMLLKRVEQKVADASEREDFEGAAQWWTQFLVLQRFLRRNRQLLAAMNDTLFLGELHETQHHYYLYLKGELLSRTSYKRRPTEEQALKKLLRSVPKQKWRSLAVKKYLSKEEVDLFPLFFNYLNRHGKITKVSHVHPQ